MVTVPRSHMRIPQMQQGVPGAQRRIMAAWFSTYCTSA
jgi:hypothetical protein